MNVKKKKVDLGDLGKGRRRENGRREKVEGNEVCRKIREGGNR